MAIGNQKHSNQFNNIEGQLQSTKSNNITIKSTKHGTNNIEGQQYYNKVTKHGIGNQRKKSNSLSQCH